MVAERKEGHMAKPPLLNQLCGVGKRLCSPLPAPNLHNNIPLKPEKFFWGGEKKDFCGLLSYLLLFHHR